MSFCYGSPVVSCSDFYFQSKFQKHQAFEAEVSANQERVLETINLAEGMDKNMKCNVFMPISDKIVQLYCYQLHLSMDTSCKEMT